MGYITIGNSKLPLLIHRLVASVLPHSHLSNLGLFNTWWLFTFMLMYSCYSAIVVMFHYVSSFYHYHPTYNMCAASLDVTITVASASTSVGILGVLPQDNEFSPPPLILMDITSRCHWLCCCVTATNSTSGWSTGQIVCCY